MCGDTHCHSCGPAQGNWRCPICRAWADDCCEHIADDGQNLKPEFLEQARLIEEAEAQADNQFAADLEAEAALAEAYWRNQALPQCCCELYGMLNCPMHGEDRL